MGSGDMALDQILIVYSRGAETAEKSQIHSVRCARRGPPLFNYQLSSHVLTAHLENNLPGV